MQSDSKLNRTDLAITYIGGPTALLEWNGLRLLTDPTFDPAGTDYPTNGYTLKRREGPAISVEKMGDIDAVPLSHDHHYDNLDHAGRKMLAGTRKVLTTIEGAARLGQDAAGLENWQSVDVSNPNGRILRITGTPARHGPANRDRGPVTGFVLHFTDAPGNCLYISGDMVWYEGVEEVARRFKVTTAILFMGAAVVLQVSLAHLTMSAAEGVLTAKSLSDAIIVPLHCAGWEHLTESRTDIEQAFGAAGLQGRLCWLEPGVPRMRGLIVEPKSI